MAIDAGVVFTIPVHSDRAEEFEAWVRDVLEPAAKQTGVMPAYTVFRTDESKPGTTLYLVVAAATSADQVELQPLFDEAYGAERSQKEVAAFEGMLSAEQSLWVLTPLP